MQAKITFWLPELRIFLINFKAWATVAKCRVSQLLTFPPRLLLFKFVFFPLFELLLPLLLLAPFTIEILLLILLNETGTLMAGFLPVISTFSLEVLSLASSLLLHSFAPSDSWALLFFFLWSLFFDDDFEEWGWGNSSAVAGNPPYPLLLLEPELLWIDLELPLQNFGFQ